MSAVNGQGSELCDLPPYTALLWSSFQQCPSLMYNLFESTIRPGDVTHFSDKVFDMSGAMFSHKLSEIKVESVEDLHRLTNNLLNMPILFRIKVEHQRVDNYVVVKVRNKWRNEFAILVNTRHPQVRQIMTEQLTKAMQYMQEGKKFCLKLDFGPSVRQWYSEVVDAEVSFCDSRSNSDSGHMELWVTNHTTPLECCMSPLCIAVCFPLWLVCGGPCYLVNRKVKCDDFGEKFRDLPVCLLTGRRIEVTIPTAVLQGAPRPQMPMGQIPPPQSRIPPNAQYPPPQFGNTQNIPNPPAYGQPPPAYAAVDPQKPGY